MTRPFNPLNQYHVSIHNTQGYRYASTQVPTVDPKTGRRRYHYIHWGRVDENNKFFPGNRYMLASVEERKKLIFPSEWDLSEIDKLIVESKPPPAEPQEQDESLLYGDIWLLEQVSHATGLREDLLKTFDGNKATVDIIQTLAIYLLSVNGSYEYLGPWQNVAKTPYSKTITPEMLVKLTQSITDQNRMDLLRHRIQRSKKDAVCAVDSAACSPPGTLNADKRRGLEKDPMPLDTKGAVVYTLHDHMPVYYRSFPRDTPASKGLEAILEDLKSAGMRDVILITDHGNEALCSLEMYIGKGQPMILGTKVRHPYVLDKIRSFGAFKHHPCEMELYPEERIYYKQYDIASPHAGAKKAGGLKLNLYFDPLRRSKEIMDVEVAVATQREALKELKSERRPLDEDALEGVYCLYNLDYDEKSRILKGFSINEREVMLREAEAGFFANTTLKIKGGAIEANRHYKLKNKQEKYFALLKGAFDGIQRIHTNCEINGMSFILFVAQILGCYLNNACATKLSKYGSVADILKEMRPIRYIGHSRTQGRLSPFSKKQAEICTHLGFSVPEGA